MKQNCKRKLFAAVLCIMFWNQVSMKSTQAFSALRLSSTIRFQIRLQQRALFGQGVSRWEVGDLVLFRENGANDQIGVIKDYRGSGWYSVQPQGTDRIMKFRGSQLTFIQEKESDEEGSALLPPPPTIHDLDELIDTLPLDPILNETDKMYIQDVANHRLKPMWVVFTDLHCAPATLETTLQVLSMVHTLAVERNAGVLFLGDWWHHRGTLRVDCLNSILDHLKTWTVPMVMIPGNHDQVTFGGQSHSLTALANSYRVRSQTHPETTLPGPLIFSYPTKFAGALFVPHIRDNAVMESVLQSNVAKNVTALFVHADVTGASMNDLIVSTGGIPPRLFPLDKAIYSGHFHKPHTVHSSGRTIQYLGSPYEVSLSEAQQPKSLVVLDATKGWQCVEEIPISIGRKHFRVNSVEEFLALGPSSSSNESNAVVNAGDRVIVSIEKRIRENLSKCQDPGEESEFDRHVRRLRRANVSVEIREINTLSLGVDARALGVVQWEVMSTEAVWNAYVDDATKRDALSSADAAQLELAGQKLLATIEPSVAFGGDNEKFTDLRLESVTVEGFGPFKNRVSYPFLGRGLVLIRGSNRDGGSDSNGSGKTSLAVSALWALSGSIDPRPSQDFKLSDVVNDSSKFARVTLKGSINGVSFSITRTKTSTKGSIVFIFNGEDLTAQSMKDTQELINEKLGVTPQVMARVIFNGQHALNDLLDQSDTKLKDELSLVVSLAVWQDAAQEARKRQRDATKNSSEMDGMLSVRSNDLLKHEAAYKSATELYSQQVDLFNEIADQHEKLSPLSFAVEANDTQSLPLDCLNLEVAEKRKIWLAAEDQLSTLNRRRQMEQNERAERMRQAAHDCDNKVKVHSRLERDFQVLHLKRDAASDRLISLYDTWSVDKTSINMNFVLPPHCPTCGQPIEGDHHSLNAMKTVVERDVQAARTALSDFENAIAVKSLELELMQREKVDAEEALANLRRQCSDLEEHWQVKIQDAVEKCETTRSDFETASEVFALAAKELQRRAQMQSMEAKLQSRKTALRSTELSLQKAEADLKACQSEIQTIRLAKNEQDATAKSMADLAAAFGQRGVQTFILRNAVDDLNACTQLYLDDLSDGALRLEIQLDAGDRISRRALVRDADGSFRERPLAALSGGQWRRCSLALNFAFADLVAKRGFRSSLYVLDEPLTHLDRSGRADVGRVLRKLLRRSCNSELSGYSTILLILQDLAAEELEEAFDCVDEVVKRGGTSVVNVDDSTMS